MKYQECSTCNKCLSIYRHIALLHEAILNYNATIAPLQLIDNLYISSIGAIR